jgi:hypothetical protein
MSNKQWKKGVKMKQQESSNYWGFKPKEMPFLRKISQYRNLSCGWHFGEGTPPNESTVGIACDLAYYSYNQKSLCVDSAPGLSGEISLALYDDRNKDSVYAETIITEDGLFDFTEYEKKNDQWNIVRDIYALSYEEIKQEICNFTKRNFNLWQSSLGFFQSPITTRILGDLVAKHSEIIKAEFLSSTGDAQWTSALQPATI